MARRTTKRHIKGTGRLGAALALAVLAMAAYPAGVLGAGDPTAVDTSFTYQGRLLIAGVPANGPFDFKFEYFTVEDGETTDLIDYETAPGVVVTDGLFSIILNTAPSVGFDGNAVNMRISYKLPSGSTYTAFSPDQRLSATPFASYALNAGKLGGLGPSSYTYTNGYGISKTGNTFSLNTAVVDGNSLNAADSSPTDAVYVDNAGNVGIGTTTPATKLTVVGSLQVGVGGISQTAISGDASTGIGVSGTADDGYGVSGYTQGSGAGVYGAAPDGWGGEFSSLVSHSAICIDQGYPVSAVPSSSLFLDELTNALRWKTSAGAVAGIPQTLKFTVTESQLTNATSGASQAITLIQPSLAYKVMGVTIKHSAAFTGGGVSNVTVSVGDDTTATYYTTACSVFVSPSNTNFNDFGGQWKSSVMATNQALKAWFTPTGGSLNGLTAGSVDIYICYVELP